MNFAINANLVHKWRRLEQCAVVPTRSVATPAMPMQTFIPLVIGAPPVPLPIDTQPQEVRIELRGGAFAAMVIWPISANAECAGLLRKLLR